MGKNVKEKGMTTLAEKGSYGLYFLGINIFYLLIYSYMNTYLTDVGISALAVAGIALVVKVWDAINDPIFGVLVDKIKFKKGKFLPWLKIAVIAIPVTTVLLFAIPSKIPVVAKIIWAIIAYILWDTAYTISDVPIFGLVTTMTSIPQERVSITAFSRVCSMVAILAVSIIIPTFRNVLGGWTITVAMLAVVGMVAMLPINFTAKERVIPESQDGQEIQDEINMRNFYCRGLGLKKVFTLTYGDLANSLERSGMADEQTLSGLRMMAAMPCIDYIEVAPHQYIEFFYCVGQEKKEERDLAKFFGYQHICLEVTDIHAAWDAATYNGIKPDTEIALGAEGAYQFWLVDPDGNRLELMEYAPGAKQLL